MTLNAIPGDRQLALAPLDEKADHVRGSPAAPLILEYGDYECPYSRQAFHVIEQVEQQLGGNMRFAFRHFPLTGIHPHALAAAAAAEAAALQGRFWDMHELLFHRQKALEDGDLRGYAARLGLDGRGLRPRPGQRRGSGRGSAATSTAAWLRARCSAPPRCSSTAWCTAAATTRPPCWPRWPHEPPCPQAAQHQAGPAGGHRHRMRRRPGDGTSTCTAVGGRSVLRCSGRANHRDPVTPPHLPGGEPGSGPPPGRNLSAAD